MTEWTPLDEDRETLRYLRELMDISIQGCLALETRQEVTEAEAIAFRRVRMRMLAMIMVCDLHLLRDGHLPQLWTAVRAHFDALQQALDEARRIMARDA